MKNVVKYCAYLDILLMGSIYVIKSTCLRGNPISGQTKSLRAPPSWWGSRTVQNTRRRSRRQQGAFRGLLKRDFPEVQRETCS